MHGGIQCLVIISKLAVPAMHWVPFEPKEFDPQPFCSSSLCILPQVFALVQRVNAGQPKPGAWQTAACSHCHSTQRQDRQIRSMRTEDCS